MRQKAIAVTGHHSDTAYLWDLAAEDPAQKPRTLRLPADAGSASDQQPKPAEKEAAKPASEAKPTVKVVRDEKGIYTLKPASDNGQGGKKDSSSG